MGSLISGKLDLRNCDQREHYRKTGEGRPTKKDRRDLDDYGTEFYTDTDATE